MTTFSYFNDNALKTIGYTGEINATSDVSFTYDGNYSRVATMTDGIGTTTYSYTAIPASNPGLGAGRLWKIDSPWSNDVIEFSYDELGRRKGTKIDTLSRNTTFDALGRVSGMQNPLGNFTISYIGTTGRPDVVSYPNGQSVDFNWHSNTLDRRLEEIRNLNPGGNSTLSKFNYSYDVLGRITSWRQENSGSATPQTWELGYDAVDRLVSGILKNASTQAVLKEVVFGFDRADNRAWEQIDPMIASDTSHALNQITARGPGGWMRFRGTVDAATVGVGGQPASVTATGVFEGYALMTAPIHMTIAMSCLMTPIL